ncbi:protein of unknown function [Methanoculleus bourgensis]|uniref:Uncharacterized protein n=1 Tax=Methanoculleus bourgensis TaxID=83986 RepID=A0A0X3BLR4_9EURY|nr:protein of unknown function [Methanoculleus bourgensis]
MKDLRHLSPFSPLKEQVLCYKR